MFTNLKIPPLFFRPVFMLFLPAGLAACNSGKTNAPVNAQIKQVISADTVLPEVNKPDTNKYILPDSSITDITKLPLVNNGVTPAALVAFAKTLIGIPYKYASVDPKQGFDCSGFITYVFNRFGISVPRSSVDFTNVGIEVPVINAKEGDLILFTGTDDSVRIVGHMGIVTENTDSLRFIHSSSGRVYGVTVSALTDHYKRRFVKVIRVF